MNHLSKNEFGDLYPVLRKFIKLFGDDVDNRGCLTGVRHRVYTGDHPPIKKRPYRLPEALKSIVQEQIDEMLKKKVISPSESPWSSPVVIVPKKSPDGKPKYRFSVDYKALNTVRKQGRCVSLT